MLTEDQLKEVLSDLESDRVERTISTANTDKFCEAVCAFANDYPKIAMVSASSGRRR